MSTLHVENLKGLSSGGNANKIIVPSGQTLVPSVGQVIHTERVVSTDDITVTTSGTTYTDVWTVNYTPKLTASSEFYIMVLQFTLLLTLVNMIMGTAVLGKSGSSLTQHRIAIQMDLR